MDFGPEMSLFAMFLGLLIGLGLGFLLGRRLGGPAGSALRERAAAHDALQREVDTHMRQTASLMDQLAHDYRAVYDHLADSAQRLGVTDLPAKPGALSHQPDTKRAPGSDSGAADRAGPSSRRRDTPAPDAPAADAPTRES